MMRRWWLLGLLGATLAWSQAKPAEPKDEPEAKSHLGEDADDDFEEVPEPSTAHAVPMDAAVITIKGFCPGNAAASRAGRKAACRTTVTRAEFEKLAGAIQPRMQPAMKQQLAAALPGLMVLSHAAKAQGMDKQPDYEAMMSYVQLQILTQALMREIQEDAGHVTARDVAAYYEKNREDFEEYSLQRLLVPLRKQGSTAEAAASAEEMTQLAEKIQERAAAGEDLVKLQKEAYDEAGISVLAPNTSMGKVRRTSLPLAHAAVLKLKPGEVSQVISDASGHYIYRLDQKDQLSLRQVKGEVRYGIRNKRIKDEMDAIQNSYSAERNEAYFGPAMAPNGGDPSATLQGQK